MLGKVFLQITRRKNKAANKFCFYKKTPAISAGILSFLFAFFLKIRTGLNVVFDHNG